MTKYNLAGNKSCYIKLYTKQGMYFGEFPAGYLVPYFPEAKGEIYKAYSPFAIEASHGAVWDD